MTRETLPPDFFETLSPKKKALFQILLDAEGDWIRGVEIRQRMREEYGLSVPHKPGATAIHLSHYTQWYSEEFRRDLIRGRRVEDSENHVELRIGEKYEDELRDWFNRQESGTESKNLAYSDDIRQDLTAGREGEFRKGWNNAVDGQEYTDETLDELTWNNLGWRLGRLFGETPDELREEMLRWCAEQRNASTD